MDLAALLAATNPIDQEIHLNRPEVLSKLRGAMRKDLRVDSAKISGRHSL